jgi:hypothetical protein
LCWAADAVSARRALTVLALPIGAHHRGPGEPLMRATAVLSLLVVLLAGGTAASQTPQAPPAPPPHPRPALRAHPANICTTQWGWCQIPTQSAAPGIACVCLT